MTYSEEFSRRITNWETLLHVDGIDGEEIVGLQIASVSRVRNFSGRIVARSFHNAYRAPRNALYDAAASPDVLIRCEREESR